MKMRVGAFMTTMTTDGTLKIDFVLSFSCMPKEFLKPRDFSLSSSKKIF